MRDSLVLYECALCHTYLENYSKATLHLGMKHSEACRINYISRTKRRNEKDDDLIKSKEFPEPVISLQCLTVKDIEELKKISKECQSQKQKDPIVRKSKTRAKSTPGRLEIKLDTLRAGEIETLITDLFKKANGPASSSKSGQAIRRSGRKVQRPFESYGELDSDEDGTVRRGSAGKLDHEKVDKDPNYDDIDVTDEDDDDGNPEEDDQSQDLNLRTSKLIASTSSNSNVRMIVTKNFWCGICRTQYEKMGPFLKHMRHNHLKNGTYTCNYCGKKTFPLKDFNRHMMKHVDPIYKGPNRKSSRTKLKVLKTEKCKICGIVLKVNGNKRRMAEHLKVHEKASKDDPSKPHVCPVCNHRFPIKARLQRHFFKHLENNPYKCEFLGCGKTFSSSRSLNRHVVLHTYRINYGCKLCPAKYSKEERLRKHVIEFHSENSKKVYNPRFTRNRTYCVKSIHELASTINIKTPETQELGENLEKDEARFDLQSVHFADRIIATEDQDIHIHGEKLSPQKRNPGPSWPASRSRSTSPLEERESNQHKSKGSKLPETTMELCDIIRSDPVVKRIQETKPESLEHLIAPRYKYNRNQIEGDFKCQICSWTGGMSYSFKKHMQNVHGAAAPAGLTVVVEPTPDQPLDLLGLTCGSCGYSSNSADDLSAHISKVHAAEKKFPCSFCGVRLSNISRRKEHEQKFHLAEKKISCTKCDAKYADNEGLRNHYLKKHDTEYQKMLKKTCKCKICGKVLSDKRCYLRHVKLHTNPEAHRVSCKICGQNCADSGVLRRHIQYVHVGVRNPCLTSKKDQEAQKAVTRCTSAPSKDRIETDNQQNKITGENSPDTSSEAQQMESNKNLPIEENPYNLLDAGNHVVENIEILGF